MNALELILLILIVAVGLVYYTKYGDGELGFIDKLADKLHDFIADDKDKCKEGYLRKDGKCFEELPEGS